MNESFESNMRYGIRLKYTLRLTENRHCPMYYTVDRANMDWNVQITKRDGLVEQLLVCLIERDGWAMINVKK